MGLFAYVFHVHSIAGCKYSVNLYIIMQINKLAFIKQKEVAAL